jgi:hypothetical protein
LTLAFMGLWPSLCGKSKASWETVGDREAILLFECFNSMDYCWLYAYRYHRINFVSRVCFPLSPLYGSAFHTCILCSYFLKYRFLIELVICCKTLWDDECSHLIKTSWTSRHSMIHFL